VQIIDIRIILQYIKIYEIIKYINIICCITSHIALIKCLTIA